MKKYFPQLADSRKKVKLMSPSNESAGDRHSMHDVLPAATQSMSGEIIHLSNHELFESIGRLSDQELEERIAILRAACGADVASLLPDKGSNSKISLFMHQHEKDRRLLAAMLPEKDAKIEDPNMKTPASPDVLDITGRANGSSQPISHLNTPEGTQGHYTSLKTIRTSDVGKAPFFSDDIDACMHTDEDIIDLTLDDGDDYDSADEREAEQSDVADQEGVGRGHARAHTITLTAHGDQLFHWRTGRCLDGRLPRQMTIAIRGRLSEGVWPTWSHVPEDVRELMCSEWMERFDFRPEELPRARRAFFLSASQRMRSLMYYARKKARCIANTSSISECIEGRGRPIWLQQEIWEGLIREHWGSSDFAIVSDKARQSRNTEVNGISSRHTGGSVPFEATEQILSAKRRRPVSWLEVFDFTHQHSDGTYVDGRAEQSAEAYKVAMHAKYGEDEESWPYIDMDIYRETFGQPKRGRYYGLGSGGIGACTIQPRRQLGRLFVGSSSRIPQAMPPAAAPPADHERRLEEMVAGERDQILQQTPTSLTTPSLEAIEQAIHNAMERQMLAFHTTIEACVDRRLEEMKKVEVERKKAEEEARNRVTSHIRSLEDQFFTMEDRLMQKITALLVRSQVGQTPLT